VAKKPKTERARFLAKVLALHALVGSDNAGEREAAHSKLVDLLSQHKANWNDLPALIAEAKAAELGAAKDPYDDPPAGAGATGVSGTGVNVADCLRAVIGDYVSAQPHELTAIALWVLHCHVYRRFMVTPRLALTSPVKGCERLDDNDPDTIDTLNALYRLAWQWAHAAKLDLDPEMPLVRNREADNWRPLVAIADSFGPAWGELARAAVIAFAQGRSDEDIGVALLRAIREVFNALRVDRIKSEGLVAFLLDMDDAPWSEWRGVRDDESPRKLSQAQLAKTLRPFGIKPRSVRFASGTAKGYTRGWFEAAWEAYCPEDGTTAQPHVVKHLGVA
jgi:Protein of unknown function (DUF3631)